MAMMDLVHVWFRPSRDELSLKRDDGRVEQNRKRKFRRKNGETARVVGCDIRTRHTRAEGLRIISVALNRVSRLGDKRTTL